jgi:dienelactone hydrolase
MRAHGARWELHTYGGVRHGFTNPAQALNAAPAFAYDAAAATASWATLERVLADEFGASG